MAEECSHDCSSCKENCESRDPKSFIEAANKGSNVKRVIGIVSGKGGVGKSLVTSLLAVSAMKKNKKAGILDADITGPSIPRMFGVSEKIKGNEIGILPAHSKSGIAMMSTNLILDNTEDPVIWRGPVIAGAVKQFWTDVCWGDLDYLFVDMPPGTGDVPLTVFQSLPVDGIMIVTSPQDLVSMIVEKAVRMAEKMDIPVLGIVENMSYVTCPDCGKKIYIFGEGRTKEIAEQHSIPSAVTLPVLPELALLCDQGKIEEAGDEALDALAGLLPD